MDGYLTKPIRAEDLDQLLNKYIILKGSGWLAPEHENQER
jgi:hypothetical protein